MITEATCYRCGKVGIKSVRDEPFEKITMVTMGWGQHRGESRCKDEKTCLKQVRVNGGVGQF